MVILFKFVKMMSVIVKTLLTTLLSLMAYLFLYSTLYTVNKLQPGGLLQSPTDAGMYGTPPAGAWQNKVP